MGADLATAEVAAVDGEAVAATGAVPPEPAATMAEATAEAAVAEAVVPTAWTGGIHKPVLHYPTSLGRHQASEPRGAELRCVAKLYRFVLLATHFVYQVPLTGGSSLKPF